MKIGDLFVALSLKDDLTKQVDKALRGAAGKVSSFASKMNRKLGAALGNRFTVAGAAAAFGMAAKDALEFDEAVTRLSISSSGAIGNVDKFKDSVLRLSRSTGVAKEELVGGVAEFVKLTGDGKTAAASMELFAKVTKATGASMDDVARSAAAMMQQSGLAAGDLEQAFSILIRGGKFGAIELDDTARIFSSLAAASQQFADSKGVDALAKLQAVMQVAAPAFAGKAEETQTGIESLMGSILQNAEKLRKVGVQVYTKDPKTGKKNARDYLKIIEAMANSKLAKDPTLLWDVLGRKEAVKTAQVLMKQLSTVRELAQASRNAKDVSQDYDKFQQSSAARVGKAWNEIKVKIAEAFTPERVEALAVAIEGAVIIASALVDLIGKIAKFIDEQVNGKDPNRDRDALYKKTYDRAKELGASPDQAAEAARKSVAFNYGKEDTRPKAPNDMSMMERFTSKSGWSSILKTAATLGLKGRVDGEYMFDPKMNSPASWGQDAPQMKLPGGTLTLNINAVATDTKALAEKVATEVVKKANEEMMRQTAAGIAGGETTP